ncbi:MAG: TRAP transporter permease [Lautropia sp.]|nr:TRAP transporter permease [Lautropia sp.]
MAHQTPPSPEAASGADADALQQLVADSDTGGRMLRGLTAGLVTFLAITWSLAQLFYASPLPFVLRIGIVNDTEARSLHLAVAMFLAFLSYPAFKGRSARRQIPLQDWLFALAGSFAAGYLFLFYTQLSERPGQPTGLDLWTAVIGMVLLLEATRRAIGWPMALLALLCLGYVFAGPYMPDVLAHKGASISRAMSQMWLGTEGVFGVALGVSVSTIFIYVLFGALLDQAGGGNYMIQASYALLGHLRGGPAKVSVISSALNGVVSGSSVANVVSTGIFTIPLMKRAGYGGVKAGAIETMASVNGQVMPPVMGAAAFLMTEYVGITYAEIVKHALMPALLAYIGLFYIVHLEALKLGLKPAVSNAAPRALGERVKAMGLGISGTIVVMCLIYYAVMGLRAIFGANSGPSIGVLLALIYLLAVWQAAKAPDLADDIDVNNPVRPSLWPTVRAGLHFFIPIGVLIWLLLIDKRSPPLAAFWACCTLLVMSFSQHALIALFRGRNDQIPTALKRGLRGVVHGMEAGARNMVGIAVATATAGVIVGTITLTGLGFRMTDLVELVSGGNVLAMLGLTAGICLVLGLGVPTTANYILVASLMAPVVVELGAQNGLIIPLVAVHLFVFYYGIMGDITPPVGLATFAASAISDESPIKTGMQGATYALRTVILPFIWIFNPQLLMIGIDGWGHALLVFSASTLAMLAFSALTQNWLRTRLRWWESLVLLAGIAILFRPDFLMDRIYDRYDRHEPAELTAVVERIEPGRQLILEIAGQTLEGDDKSKVLSLPIGERGPMAKRLNDSGLSVMAFGEMTQISLVRFGSPAQKAGFEQGWDITGIMLPADRPSPNWFYLPGVLLLALVWVLQGLRLRRNGTND